MSEALLGSQPQHSELWDTYCSWHRQNMGGLQLLWRRRSVWLAQCLQKVGMQHEVSVPLFSGQQMQVVTNECISRSIIAFGYAEPTITALMLWILASGQTMVDVGTHFGYEAVLGSKLVGTKGRVICFEPNPAAREIAEQNLTAYPQACVHGVAVGEKTGVCELADEPIANSAFASITDQSSPGKTIQVEVTTLDSFLRDRDFTVDLLKCDAEGMELQVLEGAQDLLRRDAPLLVLEADMPDESGRSSARAHELADYLTPLNYQAFSFDFQGELRFGPLDSIEVRHANIVFATNERLEQIRARAR